MSRIGDAVGETGRSLGLVARNPGLRRINLAFAGSTIGDWAYNVAIAVWAYDAGGVALVGVWQVARYAAMAFANPLTATLADRYPRKRVMIGSDLFRATVILFVALLIWGHGPTSVIFVLGCLNAAAATAFRPAMASISPSLADAPAELTASNGIVSTSESLGFFVGPAIAGLLLTVVGVPAVLLFEVATFAWSALIVARVVVPVRDTAAVAAVGADPVSASGTPTDTGAERAEEAEPAKDSFLTELLAGFRLILGDPDLRLISLVYVGQTIVAGASAVYAIAMAAELTSFGPSGLGYIESSLGVGAIIGGFIAIGRASKQTLARDFGVGVLLWALPLVLVALVPQTWVVLIAVALTGMGNPIADVNASTILQRLTPDAVLGRVFGALDTGLWVGMGFGAAVMPLLITHLGLRWALAILGLGIGLVTLPAFPRFRRLDRTFLQAPAGLELLRALPLFAPLEPSRLESLAQQLGHMSVHAGDVVIREGEPGDRFYVVDKGRTTATYAGRVLSSQGPGDPFGEIALLRDVPRTATVTADEDTDLFWLDREAFLGAIQGDADVASRADDLISRRIRTY